MADDVGLIKQALCFRAKYRYGQTDKPYFLKLHPMLVVPHPRNRSGEPVKSLRTRELSGTIAKDGADADEANLAAICIMDLDEPDEGRIRLWAARGGGASRSNSRRRWSWTLRWPFHRQASQRLTSGACRTATLIAQVVTRCAGKRAASAKLAQALAHALINQSLTAPATMTCRR